uniref:Integrase catalytic domain-containing protein n=1 Tax=Romanomermis culicivorax TaxID=13658 RepID=A0A915HIP3_ROMCU
MIEHFHQTLIAQLKKYTAEDLDNWERYFPYAVFAYNAMPHTATRYSPFSLLRDASRAAENVITINSLDAHGQPQTVSRT